MKAAQNNRQQDEVQELLRIDYIQNGSVNELKAILSDVVTLTGRPRTAAERKSAQRKRDAENGLKQLNIKLPILYHDAIKCFAKYLVSDNDNLDAALSISTTNIAGFDIVKTLIEKDRHIDIINGDLSFRIDYCIQLESMIDEIKSDCDDAVASAQLEMSAAQDMAECWESYAQMQDKVILEAKSKIHELEKSLSAEQKRSLWNRLFALFK